MNRNRFLTLLAVLCLTALIVAPAQAAKSYYAERFDVRLDIQTDGSLLVTETVVFRFEGGPFTYVFREISRNNTDNIQVLEASMDGIAFQPGGNAGQVETVDGDPIKVTWHFDPQSDSTHEFILHYRVGGVIRSGTADTLVWAAIPEEHDYNIKTVSITLIYPLGVRPLEDPSLDRASDLSHLDSGVRLSVTDISENEGVTLLANFSPGSLVSTPPAWQSRAGAETAMVQRALPFGLGMALLVGLVGLVLVITATRRFRREGYAAPSPIQRVTVLPGDIAPALAGRLAGGGTPFLGTLFDLARRGLLGFQEGRKQWGSRTFNVIRYPGNPILAAHERIFIEAFLKKGNIVPLSDIASLAYNSKFNAALDGELASAGLRDNWRSAQRSKIMLWTALALAAGIAIFFFGILLINLSLLSNEQGVFLGASLAGAGLATSLAGLAGLLAAALISPLSNEGVYQAGAWKSFTGYLHAITRGQAASLQPELFERYLPYAAAFGIVSEWGKLFSKMADVPVPVWVQGLGSSLDDGSFIALLAVLSSADSSTSAASGAGAAGASGGGASGAG